MAARDSSPRPLQKAMRLVKEAIQLDTRNRQKEAYCEYLRSVNYISHILLQNAVSPALVVEEDLEAAELVKMVRLAEQCLERVKSCLERRKGPPGDERPPTTAPGDERPPTTAPALAPPRSTAACPNAIAPGAQSKWSRAVQPRHSRVSEAVEAPAAFLPPEVFQKIQAAESQDSRKELTPIQEASRLNQKLKANYEARLSRLSPSQASQKTSLTLSLQRQMTENIIIARAREQALCRKMEERRLRLQEQANRRFSSSATVTPRSREQRVLYANILEYEQDQCECDWPKVWKANLKKNPNDATLVSGLLAHLLSCLDHPVMKLLKRLQCEVYQRLYPLVRNSACPVSLKLSRSAQSLAGSSPDVQVQPGLAHSLSDASLSLSMLHDLNADDAPEMDSEQIQTPTPPDRENSFEDLEQFLTQMDWVPAPGGDDTVSDMTFDSTHGDLEAHIQDLEERALKEHLKAIVKDVMMPSVGESLLSLCLLSFECLNTASAKDQCVACIEEVFFMPIWSPLLALFRKVHRERELAFENSVHLYRNASPGDVGVAPKLFPKDMTLLHGSYPYECAVQELKQLCRDHCPQRKLECIVRTLRLICACAEHYRLLQDNKPVPQTAAMPVPSGGLRLGRVPQRGSASRPRPSAGHPELADLLKAQTTLPNPSSRYVALRKNGRVPPGIYRGGGIRLTSMQSALTYVESLHMGGASHQAARST
ncbi:LOW QUALITY PROTEIN: VPS9 domain-containing protein 1 [Electrophorus electricus]|uniref:LOW QUALITY PROTEIN: VPS9 domain-containing protein 1 n=1 Tax=Electrophorus electricus TaxID=8005 RepID=UPI0015D05BD5|nr:LOW QUALITY PROTEIN: VPS9 domain-containing protein 1 [Electrophorus electricus]